MTNLLRVAQQKQALGLKLKGKELQALETHLIAKQHRKRSQVVDVDNGFVVKKSFDAEPIISAVKDMAAVARPVRNDKGNLYLGSIDPITAVNWSRECGAAVGTKEFAKYAKKKLMSGEFSRFKADYQRKFV